MKPKGIFISYAHKDRTYLERLQTHLAPYLVERHLGLWSDQEILPGDRWRGKIEQAIDDAAVAVLLVSADFLDSAFIRDFEMPRLLKRADAEELRLIPVSVGYGAHDVGRIADYQYANDPRKPLEGLSRPELNQALASIARKIDNTYTMARLAFGLGVIDQTTEPMEARIDGRAERPDHVHGIVAQYRPVQDEILFSNTSEVLTMGDVERLSDDDREYIADLEETMGKQYERWRKVRRNLGNAGGALDDEVESEMQRIEKLMCGDLDQLIRFIETMLGGVLQDHYGRYRSICDRL